MKNNILLKTNLLVSVILLVGFALIATLSYRANYNASLVKIKQVSSLASEGIYYRLSTMLTKPVNISQTMPADQAAGGRGQPLSGGRLPGNDQEVSGYL